MEDLILLNKKIILSILLVSFLVMSSVNAADSFTNDTVSISDDSYADESISNTEDSISDSKSFSDLNIFINNNSDWNIHLSHDYAYNSTSDSEFLNGIVISRSINIYGDGHTIDGNGLARIFNVTASYASFDNITFINANSQGGSAITGVNYGVSNSRFINNHAVGSGGAMAGGQAFYCIFENNAAGFYGGAAYDGSADNCRFINNSAQYGGAINDVYATKSTFINNHADKYGGAMYGSSASDCTFIGNSADEMSGAVFNAYIRNSNFINNTANNGGAVGGGLNSAQNCNFTGNVAVKHGGASYGYTVDNCQFRQNHANDGGAVYTGSASNCIFERNHATNDGGAILDAYAVKCNFINNSAVRGGAMFQNSALSCNFTYNTAEYGGAMFNAHSDTCKFMYNKALIQGGAIDEGGSDSSEFRYNSAHNGGAVSLTDLVSCGLFYNNATEYGGAAYKTSARGCYFAYNVAKYGGALSVSSSASTCIFKYNEAKITGGAKFDAYVADSEFEGNLPVYNLYVSDFKGVYGFGGDIHIGLYDNSKYPVTGVNATIKLYNSKNKLVGTYKSEVGYNWFVNLAAGQYKASITVDDDCYEIDPIKISITFLKSSSIYVANLTTNYQAGKVLLVNLHDSAGKIIKYAKVYVTLNGVTTKYRTDDNGQVMIPTKSLTPNTYPVFVQFAGDSTYAGSSANAKIVVNKLTPKIIAYKATFKRYKTKLYSIVLKDNKGYAMKYVKLKFKVNGVKYSAKTSKKGIATFNLKKLTKKGVYKGYVIYGGTSIYNPLSVKVKIVIK